MKSGLNLYLMSAEGVVQWYKPQTEQESYLVNLLSETSSKTAKNLQDEVDELLTQNEILENDKSRLEDEVSDLISENENLKLVNARLEEQISDLENQLLEELDRN